MDKRPSRSAVISGLPMSSSTQLVTRRVTQYHDEASRIRGQADAAEELWVQRQLRDIANRYDVVAKTIEMIHQD